MIEGKNTANWQDPHTKYTVNNYTVPQYFVTVRDRASLLSWDHFGITIKKLKVSGPIGHNRAKFLEVPIFLVCENILLKKNCGATNILSRNNALGWYSFSKATLAGAPGCRQQTPVGPVDMVEKRPLSAKMGERRPYTLGILGPKCHHFAYFIQNVMEFGPETSAFAQIFIQKSWHQGEPTNLIIFGDGWLH